MIKIQLLGFNVHHAHIKEAGSRPGRPPLRSHSCGGDSGLVETVQSCWMRIPSVHLCQIAPRPDGFGDGLYGGVAVTWSNNRGDLDPIPSGVLLLSDDGCDRRWVGCYSWSLSGRH